MQAITTSQVDRAGVLKAQIADLSKELEAIKDQFKDNASDGGPKEVEGELFRLVYSEANVSTVDYKKLCADLGITAEQIAKYTRTSARFTVNINSR